MTNINELYEQALALAETEIPLMHREANSDYFFAYESLQSDIKKFKEAKSELLGSIVWFKYERAELKGDPNDQH